MIQSLPVLFILDSVHSGSARWDNCGPAFPDECFAVTLCPDPGDMVTVKPLKTDTSLENVPCFKAMILFTPLFIFQCEWAALTEDHSSLNTTLSDFRGVFHLGFHCIVQWFCPKTQHYTDSQQNPITCHCQLTRLKLRETFKQAHTSMTSKNTLTSFSVTG